MKKLKEFPFDLARRITEEEVQSARKAIEEVTKVKRKSRRGRPPKVIEKFVAVSIRLHPKVLTWAKLKAKKRGVGYQTIINEYLLNEAA
jgi:uncharacterized protein (DUF4415 family)